MKHVAYQTLIAGYCIFLLLNCQSLFCMSLLLKVTKQQSREDISISQPNGNPRVITTPALKPGATRPGSAIIRRTNEELPSVQSFEVGAKVLNCLTQKFNPEEIVQLQENCSKLPVRLSAGFYAICEMIAKIESMPYKDSRPIREVMTLTYFAALNSILESFIELLDKHREAFHTKDDFEKRADLLKYHFFPLFDETLKSNLEKLESDYDSLIRGNESPELTVMGDSTIYKLLDKKISLYLLQSSRIAIINNLARLRTKLDMMIPELIIFLDANFESMIEHVLLQEMAMLTNKVEIKNFYTYRLSLNERLRKRANLPPSTPSIDNPPTSPPNQVPGWNAAVLLKDSLRQLVILPKAVFLDEGVEEVYYAPSDIRYSAEKTGRVYQCVRPLGERLRDLLFSRYYEALASRNYTPAERVDNDRTNKAS